MKIYSLLIVLIMLTIMTSSGQTIIAFEFDIDRGAFVLPNYHFEFMQHDSSGSITTIITFPGGGYHLDTLYSNKKNIDIHDCQKLWSFLDGYRFHVESIQEYIFKKVYVKTEKLPDSIRYVVNGDTIRKSLLAWFNYTYDEDSNKCYRTDKYMTIGWNDGKIYTGKFSMNEKRKAFVAFEDNINSETQDLFKLLYRLIRKYGKDIGNNELGCLKAMLKLDNHLNKYGYYYGNKLLR